MERDFFLFVMGENITSDAACHVPTIHNNYPVVNEKNTAIVTLVWMAV